MSWLITLGLLALFGVLYWKVFHPMTKNANQMMQNLNNEANQMMQNANQMMQSISEQGMLAKTGELAQGRVLQLQDTGTLVNHQPLVRITVEVQPSGRRAQYQAVFETVVSMIALPRIQPGQVIPLRIDPTNPTRVALGHLV